MSVAGVVAFCFLVERQALSSDISGANPDVCRDFTTKQNKKHITADFT